MLLTCHHRMSIELSLLAGLRYHSYISYHQFVVSCHFLTDIPPWYDSLLRDFIVLAKEKGKKGEPRKKLWSSCQAQYIFSFVSCNNSQLYSPSPCQM
jgi:hypothetical protein